jgi:HEAT repeat protein
VRRVTQVHVLLAPLVLLGCSSGGNEPRVQSSREYAAEREREINDAGPTWEQRLAAAPGADDIERAIALAKSTGDYDFGAVDFLANELMVAKDPRIVAALIDVVDHAAFPSRNRAATALAKAGITEARTVILLKLHEPNFAGDLVAALGALGDESTVRELTYLAERTEDPQVRRNANSAKHLIAVRLARAD